jgi:ABC-type sugar transport system ATPase subunit
MESEELVLEARSIYKSFGGNHVLKGVDFKLAKGEVHALLGINGAGKSTLIKIISGALTPDKGVIAISNIERQNLNPRKARELGVATIYQETSLYPKLSVLENLFVGRRIKKNAWQLDWKAMEVEGRKVFERLGVEIDLYEKLENFGKATAQLVEIARSLIVDSNILIMDEPTSSLSGKETLKLFEVIRKLKQHGTSIIYISHRMEEIFEITDCVTILRDGLVIGTKPTREATHEWVSQSMLGDQAIHQFHRAANKHGDVLLDVRNLGNNGNFRNINFKVHRGEVLVLVGLVGSGRTEVARTILGVDSYKEGEIRFKGRLLKNNVGWAIKEGIGMVPEDRGRQGLILQMKAHDNLVMAALPFISKFACIRNFSHEKQIVDQLAKDLRVQPNNPDLAASSFSGGNQQKVVIGKWLATESDLLILDEPTCGVDVGAKIEIYRLIDKMAAEGKGILMITSDFAEVELVADRILLMSKGQIIKEMVTAELPESGRTDYILKYALKGGE